MYSINLNIPTYRRKDTQVLIFTMLPLTVLLNTFLFGKRYFTEIGVALFATVVTFGFLAGCFLLYKKVLQVLKIRFPEERQSIKRIGFSIVILILLSAVLLSFVF